MDDAPGNERKRAYQRINELWQRTSSTAFITQASEHQSHSGLLIRRMHPDRVNLPENETRANPFQPGSDKYEVAASRVFRQTIAVDGGDPHGRHLGGM